MTSRTNESKVILITGASSGIGEGAARLLARQGHRLVIGARRTDRLAELAQSIEASGGIVRYRELDVTSVDDVAAFARFALDAFGAPQSQIEGFEVALGGAEELDELARVPLGRERLGPARQRGHVGPATQPVERVGGGTEPQILRANPVGGIVARAVPRPRERRHLVMLEARLPGRATRGAILGRERRIGSRQPGAALDARVERRPGLDREPVQRQVRDRELEGDGEIARPGAPTIDGGSGGDLEVEDQIQRHVVEARFRCPSRN